MPSPVAKPVEPPPAPARRAGSAGGRAGGDALPADKHDRAGVPDARRRATARDRERRRRGHRQRARASGEGEGAGIGPGSGGGTGGGPYRPGSGITPPSLLREVKPDYTEDARRRGIEGDVVLEIVVRSDGTVGDVRLLQGLGAGLDQRAIDAVRQWRFAPARGASARRWT